MKRIIGMALIAGAIAVGSAGVATAAPIGSGNYGNDGTSIDKYRYYFGYNNDGDAGHQIDREMKLRQLGWHGNNN